jgi:hypothetical protein
MKSKIELLKEILGTKNPFQVVLIIDGNNEHIVSTNLVTKEQLAELKQDDEIEPTTIN